MSPHSLESLQSTWRTLYSLTLPSLARARDPAQSKWPVALDHCFARIILDNTIGKSSASEDDSDTQWDKVIGKPAIKHMSEGQLRDAIELGEKIRTGQVDLVDLDEASLKARGKKSKRKANDKMDHQEVKSPKKRRHNEDGKTQSTLSFSQSQDGKRETQTQAQMQSEREREPRQLPSPAPEDASGEDGDKQFPANPTPEFFRATLKRIKDSDITPFRKRLYTILLSVPRGEYTTYAAMATYLDSAARAVGNGMRNNPFAPHVPCHRVLASNGTIGGFYGSWTKKGETHDHNITKKIQMLKEEGVRFDSMGKVKGPVWKGFKDMNAFEKELGKVI